MKLLFTLLISLGLSLVVLASTDLNPEDAQIKRAEKMAQKIYEVYALYKNKDEEACKKVMQSLSFKLSKDVVKHVPKGATVDSLVFKNDELSRWAYFKSVDLGYIRDIEAVITLKDANSNLILSKVVELLQPKHGQSIKESKDGWTTIQIKDTEGTQVVDDRFQVNTVSKIQRLFSYEISTNGEYLMIDLKESVPRVKMQKSYIVTEKLQKK